MMARTHEVDGPTGVEGLTLDSRAIASALGVVTALSVIAFVVFAGVAVHELQYASGHPFAYGPAKVIAVAAAAGALLSAAVAVLGRALLRAGR
jgi:hypothetical protein